MNAIANFFRTLANQLFSTPQRLLVTSLVGLIIWGMVQPEKVGFMIATAYNNFWHAFGPLIQQLIAIGIVIGVLWMLARSLFGKTSKK